MYDRSTYVSTLKHFPTKLKLLPPKIQQKHQKCFTFKPSLMGHFKKLGLSQGWCTMLIRKERNWKNATICEHIQFSNHFICATCLAVIALHGSWQKRSHSAESFVLQWLKICGVRSTNKYLLTVCNSSDFRRTFNCIIEQIAKSGVLSNKLLS